MKSIFVGPNSFRFLLQHETGFNHIHGCSYEGTHSACNRT
jgi:hypothetical protein